MTITRKSGTESAPVREKTPRSGLGTLLHKELADHLNSNRFFLLFALLAVACVAALYGALSELSDAGDSDFLLPPAEIPFRRWPHSWPSWGH